MKFAFQLRPIPLLEFTRRLFLGGGISFKGFLLLPVYYLQLIFSLPFQFLQFLFFHNRIKNTPLIKEPVFILGHYRSGTTYLQKLLASDDQFGILTNYDTLFPNSNLLFGKRLQPFIQRLINYFKIKNPFFHDTLVSLSEPGEEDDYLMNKASPYSAYWGLVYPRRWREWLNGSRSLPDYTYRKGWKKEYLDTVKYATYKNKGKQLVLKSPPNTERIRILLEIFPQAKFIYLDRNPYFLFYSMRNMWTGAILKYYSLQTVSMIELEEMILGHYEYLMEHYEQDKKLIPEGNLIEISYEALKMDSINTLQKIYSALQLSGFESTGKKLMEKIETESTYSNFEYRLEGATLKRIEARWGKYIRIWQDKRFEENQS